MCCSDWDCSRETSSWLARTNEENADNTDYAEKVARRELDYVKPGERVFYNVGGNN